MKACMAKLILSAGQHDKGITIYCTEAENHYDLSNHQFDSTTFYINWMETETEIELPSRETVEQYIESLQ